MIHTSPKYYFWYFYCHPGQIQFIIDEGLFNLPATCSNQQNKLFLMQLWYWSPSAFFIPLKMSNISFCFRLVIFHLFCLIMLLPLGPAANRMLTIKALCTKLELGMDWRDNGWIMDSLQKSQRVGFWVMIAMASTLCKQVTWQTSNKEEHYDCWLVDIVPGVGSWNWTVPAWHLQATYCCITTYWWVGTQNHPKIENWPRENWEKTECRYTLYSKLSWKVQDCPTKERILRKNLTYQTLQYYFKREREFQCTQFRGPVCCNG